MSNLNQEFGYTTCEYLGLSTDTMQSYKFPSVVKIWIQGINYYAAAGGIRMYKVWVEDTVISSYVKSDQVFKTREEAEFVLALTKVT